MGLDIVELFLEAENKFGIEIPDDQAPSLRTAGDLHAFVVRARGVQSDSPEAVALWHEVRALIVAELGVEPTAVAPSAAFIDDLKVD